MVGTRAGRALAALAVAANLVLSSSPTRGGSTAGASGDSQGGGGQEEKAFFALEDEVVTLATKRAVRATEAPAIVSVVTAKEIREHGYRSVGEALQWIPGFYALDDGAFMNFGVRGVNAGDRGNSRILKVLIDGQPTSFRSTTANFLGPELIPIGAIEKIEVVRGPGSALYGANAFLGVVNVVTRAGRDVKGVEVRGRGELDEEIRTLGGGGELVGGGAIGDLEGMAAGSYFRYDRSGVLLPDTSPLLSAQRVAGQLATEDDIAAPASFYSRLGYDLHELGKLTLHGSFERLDSATPFQDLNPIPFVGSPPATQQVRTTQTLDQGFVRLLHELKAGDRVETAVSVAYATGGPDGRDRFDTGQPTTFFIRRYGYESFDLTAQAGVEVVKALHVTLGVDYTADDHELLTYTAENRVTGAETELEPRASRTIDNLGLYAQAIVTPVDPLSFTLGIRLDENSIYGDQLNGRAGAVWKLTDAVALKLLFGSSFQSPSPELLFGALSQPFDIDGNPDLRPQRAYSWEAQLGYRTDRYGASVNGFYNRIKDLAVFVPEVGGNLHAENAVDLDSYGFEGEGFVRFGDLGLRAAVSYQRTLRVDAGRFSSIDIFPTREQDLFPRWIATLSPSYRVPVAPLVLTWDNMWVDERLASVSNVSLNGAPYRLSDYFLSTITLSTLDLELAHDVNAFAMLQAVDLFDERPYDPGFNGTDFPSLGRRYVLTAGMRF